MRLALVVLVACGGSSGHMTNPRRDPASFVTEHQRLLVESRGGVMRVDLDGSHVERIAHGRFHLLAASRDGSVLALGDSDTNLFVTVDGEPPRQVHAFDGRTGEVALSPDGKRLAVARHADFSCRKASGARPRTTRCTSSTSRRSRSTSCRNSATSDRRPHARLP